MNSISTDFPLEKVKFCDVKSDTWDWVIKENGNEIGRCRYTLEHDHIYIDDVVVSKECRKKGIGTFLLIKLEEFAKENGYSEIRGTATAYEQNGPNYKEELTHWWKVRGYEFRFLSSQTLRCTESSGEVIL